MSSGGPKSRGAKTLQKVGKAGIRPGVGASAAADGFPRRWPQPNVDRIRQRLELADTKTPGGRDDFFGQGKAGGELPFDQSLVDDVMAQQDTEIERRQQYILEEYVYDPSDGYQRQKLDSLFPSYVSTRRQYNDLVMDQMRFIARMGLESEFKSRDEINRLMGILGGLEKLYCMGAPFFLYMYPDIAVYFEQSQMDRWPLYYKDDRWYNEAGIAGSAVHNLLMHLAKSVLHRFPRLLAGKWNIMQKGKAEDRKAKRITAEGAAYLLKIAHGYCETVSPGRYFNNVVSNMNKHSAPNDNFGSPLNPPGYPGDRGFDVV